MLSGWKFRIDLRRACQLVQNLTPLGGYVNAASLIALCALDRSVGGQHDTADPDRYRPPFICGRHVSAGGRGREYAVPERSSLRGIVRLGMSVNLPFVTRTALASLPADKVDIGAGTLNFCRQLGASLGTAVWVVFLDIRTHFHSDVLASTQSASNAASQEMLAGVRRVLEQIRVRGCPPSIGRFALSWASRARAGHRARFPGRFPRSVDWLLARDHTSSLAWTSEARRMSVDTVDELFARFGRAYVPMVMATGMVASFVMVVSSTIVNVAVPDVMGAFGIGQDQAQLMATAFNVSMTASQLLNAWVVAVLGQRYGFAAALIIYTCGSVIGGYSQDFNMIVLGRVLQGIASGIIQPLILVTIFQVFPQERRGFAAGIYSMALMLAVAMGPVFGGLAMEVLDWRYIFIAPLPVIGIAFVAGMFVLPSNRQETNRPFDWTGYGLMVVTLFCFMTGLTDGQREGWTVRLHPRLVYDFDLVGGCLHLFAIQIRRADHGDVALSESGIRLGDGGRLHFRPRQLRDGLCSARLWAVGARHDTAGCRSRPAAVRHRGGGPSTLYGTSRGPHESSLRDYRRAFVVCDRHHPDGRCGC